MTTACQLQQTGCQGNGTLVVGSATYTTLGQLSSLGYDNMAESRSYNSLMQLARITTQQANANGSWATIMDMQYVYPQNNNGRISQSVDGVVNETVNYTYDALNRLSTAAATNGSGAGVCVRWLRKSARI